MEKKVFFLISALAIVISSAAQKSFRQSTLPQRHNPVIRVHYPEKETPLTGTRPVVKSRIETRGSSDLAKTLIGSSRNIFGSLSSSQTCLIYNEDLEKIMFTHRGNNKGSIALFGTGDDIVTSFSSDEGDTFQRKMALSNSTKNHYPSGVLYNPPGNTDTANFYTLVAGPVVPDSVATTTYLHSGKYDGTFQDHQEISVDPVYQELMRNHLTATGDGKFHISAIGNTNDGLNLLTCKLFDMNGTWNSVTQKVDWQPKGVIIPDLFIAPSDNRMYFNDSYSQAAWSKDGSVGYLVMIGSDNRPTDKPSHVPIIWKSTDGGTTWNIMDYFDWSTINAITDYTLPTRFDTSVYKPFFEEASAVVDANNKLHLFALVRGGYSAHPDSLDYVHVRASTGTIKDGNIMEFYLNENDNWRGWWIDSISSDAVPPDKSYYYNTPENVGWNHRLSAAISEDGYWVFCTWTDSDWIFWGTEPYNLNPDLMGWGRNIDEPNGIRKGEMGDGKYFDVKNFTAETDFWGLAFFHFLSPVVRTIHNFYSYELPISITDINTSGLWAQEPVYYYYLRECYFPLLWESTRNSSIRYLRASPCYPNPFKGSTRINLTLEKPSETTIDIHDITGKFISSTRYGVLEKGKHTLTIDGASLLPGVYLYTINTGDQTINKKMIVK